MGYIIDSAIRCEQKLKQAQKVHSEKCKMYNPTINCYKTKFDVSEISVTEFMVRRSVHLVIKFI